MKSITLCCLLIYFFPATAGSRPSAYESVMGTNTSDTLQIPDAPLLSGQVYQFANNKEFIYEKPKLFQFLQHAPKDFYINMNESLRLRNLWKIGALAAATGILVIYDQPIRDKSKQFSRRLNLSSAEGLTSYIKVGGLSMRGPTDISPGIFFLGDGWTHTFIAASFLSYGLISHNYRSLQTASQLAEGFLTTGLTVQLLKHVSGRETPNSATVPGGVWKPFPNQAKYNEDSQRYNSYPSGHLATSMMTVTVIAENYPGNRFIRPLGYTLMALLTFQMLNNGMHWSSDYPLGIVLGYTFGKIAVRRGRTELSGNRSVWQDYKKPLPPTSLKLTPTFFGHNGIGLAIQYQF